MEPLKQARTDLGCYCAAMWAPFVLAPHHRVILDTLEAVERAELDRVIIAMPPRHGKSTIVSALYPAWFLGKHPTGSIIAASYGQELASDFGRRVRNFASDRLHRQIFPDCVISDDSDSVHRFHTNLGGAYFAIGAGGPITGRGGDLVVVDDPIKNAEDARSATFRKSLCEWYQHVLYPRLEPGGRIVIVATRWHEADLCGWLLKEHADEGWRVVSLPAVAESDDLLGRPEGAALWPERYPIETLSRIREAIGGSAWASLYQQRPTPEQGGIFRRDWFKPSTEGTEYRRVIFSLDTAFKAGASNDYSVIMVIGESATGYHLLHVVRERLEFPLLQSRAVALAAFWQPHAVLIEDAASGQSLIQALKAETRLPILPVRPQGDKESRAHAVSPLVEAGRVYLPDSASWREDFLDEVTSFPAAPHDDQVDALTQALGWLRGNGGHLTAADHAFLARSRAELHRARYSGAVASRATSCGHPECAQADARDSRARVGRRLLTRDDLRCY